MCSPACPTAWLPSGESTPWVSRPAAGSRTFVRVARREVVRGPLPDVTGGVVKPVAVRREHLNRRGALVAVGLEILPGKAALPSVGHHLPFGRTRPPRRRWHHRGPRERRTPLPRWEGPSQPSGRTLGVLGQRARPGGAPSAQVSARPLREGASWPQGRSSTSCERLGGRRGPTSS